MSSAAGSGAGEPLLRLEGLTAGYRERTVVEDVSFTVPRRGVFALMGPSGVGKSTILRTLSRWNEALPSFWHRGRVELEGRDLFSAWDREEVHRRLPLLNQTGRLWVSSVLDNVLAALAKDDSGAPVGSRAERVGRARAALEAWGLWEDYAADLDRPVIDLPIGRQRRLAVARLQLTDSACLLFDEPFRDLPLDEQERLIGLIRKVGADRTVILSSHNQQMVRRIGDRVALLVDGRIVEVASAERFFEAPESSLARDYVRYGNCWPRAAEPGGGDWSMVSEEDVASGRHGGGGVGADALPPGRRVPGSSTSPEDTAPPEDITPPEDIAPPDDTAPPDAAAAPALSGPPLRPDELHWVEPGLLGGCQQPGLLRDLDRELAGLCQLGCEVLVCLRERDPATDRVERFGLESVHFPVVDMEVPELGRARELCRRLWEWVDAGRTVVLHCKAGLGRTGTLLACALVYRGDHPVTAIERVRTINPRYIQSDVQLAFIGEFGDDLERRPARDSIAAP